MTMDMRSTTSCLTTRTTLAILFSFVTMSLLISITFIYDHVSPSRLLNPVKMRADERQYNAITEKYIKTLSSIPRHQYGSSESYTDTGPPVSSSVNVSQAKLILLWTSFFGKINWVDETSLQRCPVRCQITTNKADLPRSAAVVIHPRDLSGDGKRKGLPATDKRLPWQRWIYVIQESPFHTGINLGDFNNVFNWTATYRLDSDISLPYGELERRPVPMEKANLDILMSDIVKSKKKLVAARISNCDTLKTNRLKYIAELKKHIPVDFYGKCGDTKIPSGQEGDDVLRQYKFYLSFENSNCRDYISEKLWYPLLNWRSVPIVMGAAPEDYRAVAPNQSYIHTDGFESPKHLVEYLRLLDRNVDLYQRFFTWHKYWQPTSNPLRNWVCNICAKLHNMSMPRKSYRNFKGWYREEYCKF